MAHFAQLDENNNVINVIVIDNKDTHDSLGKESEEVGIQFCKNLLGQDTNWVQTSYNANFRGKYAGIGDFYNVEKNVFIPPKPFESWLLNETTYQWEAPIPYPNDNQSYFWNEQTKNWELVAV